jgi:hypothetical protein
MISGHSYLSNDSDPDSIQKFAKGKFIYVPIDCYSAIVSLCSKRPFVVIEMTQAQFLSTQALEKVVMHHEKNESNDKEF